MENSSSSSLFDRFVNNVNKQLLTVISHAEYFSKNPRADRHEDPPKEPLDEVHAKLLKQHSRYQQYKEENSETSLEFSAYVVHTAVRLTRSIGDIFAFKYKRLCFEIMADGESDDSETWTIKEEKFLEWAHIFYPITHKRTSERLFEALSGREDSINLKIFIRYILCLQEEWRMKFKEEPEIAKVAPSERIIFTLMGVGDLEYVIPNIGFIGLTEKHLIFQSNLTKSVRSWDISHVSADGVTIRGFLKSGVALRVTITDPTGRINQRNWDFANANTRNVVGLRDVICDQIKIMSKANNIVNKLLKDDNDGKAATVILKEAGDECLRQRALDATITGARKSVSFFIRSIPRKLTEYVEETREELKKSSEAADASKQAQSSVFSQISNLFQDDVKELDPEADDERLSYLSKEEDGKDKDEEINLQKVTENMKILQLQLRIFFIASILVQDLHAWTNPIASLSTMLFLLWMAYADYVKYIPALLCLMNGMILLLNKMYPKILKFYRRRVDILFYPPTEDDDDTEKETENISQKKESLIEMVQGRIKSAKSTYEATKKRIGSVQNIITSINTVLFKIRNVYSWRAPKQASLLMAISFLGFLSLAILPHRIIFALCVIGAFTSSFSETSSIKDFLNEVPGTPPPNFTVPSNAPSEKRRFSLKQSLRARSRGGSTVNSPHSTGNLRNPTQNHSRPSTPNSQPLNTGNNNGRDGLRQRGTRPGRAQVIGVNSLVGDEN